MKNGERGPKTTLGWLLRLTCKELRTANFEISHWSMVPELASMGCHSQGSNGLPLRILGSLAGKEKDCCHPERARKGSRLFEAGGKRVNRVVKEPAHAMA
jgi:hypothetical protein